MPARYKDYPIYTYDEPAIYRDFSGGINTNPDSDTLKDNELQLCVNMTYDNKVLCKRKGINIESKFICEDDLSFIQGIFLLPAKVTYIIVASDGKLYYGLYSSDTIELKRLKIEVPRLDTTLLFNPKDTSAGLDMSYYEWDFTSHDGYIYASPEHKDSKEFDIIDLDTAIATIAAEFKDTPGANAEQLEKLEKYTIFNDSDKVYYRLDSAIYKVVSNINTAKSLLNKAITPLNKTYWEVEESKDSIDYLVVWDYSSLHWYKNQVVQYGGKLYKCLVSHRTYEAFYSTRNTTFYEVPSFLELIFQNKYKIEGTTFQNCLYLATGTRFIKIFTDNYSVKATIVEPYMCNGSEIQNIGYNYLSPYPELCVTSQYSSASTSINRISVHKNIYGRFKLTPIMTFKGDSDKTHFLYRWEKCVNGIWYVLHSYKDNLAKDPGYYYEILVDDADKYLYRVTYADVFELPTTLGVTDITAIPGWDDYADGYEFKPGDWVKHNNTLYQCVNTHIKSDSKNIKSTISTPSIITTNNKQFDYVDIKVMWDDKPSFLEETPEYTETSLSADGYPMSTEYKSRVLWEPLMSLEAITKIHLDNTTEGEWDLTVDMPLANSSQASTVLFDNKLDVETTFLTIHSCKKVLTDGNKLLLYDDAYNTGCWFKTILNNPSYITDKGSLSFKTTKNERLVKVVPYNTVLIAFANSDTYGGSIHLIEGSGDDYDDGNYYSPYQRSTLNTEVSCDNPDTVQICEGFLIFKYQDSLYYIMPSSSELQNESLFVYSLTDKLKNINSSLISAIGCEIPWNDNSCISEVTEDYYGLIWNSLYYGDSNNIYTVRPTLRLKIYYKMLAEDTTKYSMPALLDTFDYNISNIITIQGKSKYLIDNMLFTSEGYVDNGKVFPCYIYTKSLDMGYPKQVKFINSVILGNQKSLLEAADIKVIVKNESEYVLLDSSKKTLQNLRNLSTSEPIKTPMKLGMTQINNTVYNTQYKYPCLSASVLITARTQGMFSLSSITFVYTSAETPDGTPFDNYTKIIRKGDIPS